MANSYKPGTGKEWVIMQLGRLIDVALAIVAVATASVVVGSPNTASIIKAFGDSFSGALSAAKG